MNRFKFAVLFFAAWVRICEMWWILFDFFCLRVLVRIFSRFDSLERLGFVFNRGLNVRIDGKCWWVWIWVMCEGLKLDEGVVTDIDMNRLCCCDLEVFVNFCSWCCCCVHNFCEFSLLFDLKSKGERELGFLYWLLRLTQSVSDW